MPSFLVKSVEILKRVLFLRYPLTWEIQIRRNGKRRCVQVASFELFKIHIVWRMQASHTHVVIESTENLGFVFSK